ncbi:hypothetical protein ACF0H5_002758 [Mactra antiquata]
MTISRTRTLVTTNWLREQISSNWKKTKKNLRILDTTFSKNKEIDSYTEGYLKNHIPQSLFFDLHRCVESTPQIPRNLPDLKCFENYVQSLGVWPDTHIVAYDRDLPSSAYRTWWTFRLFGHRNISILDGGYRKWLTDGFDVTMEQPSVERSNFTINMDSSLLRNYVQMMDNVTSHREQVVDARAPDSDSVVQEELDGGVIPSSMHVSYDHLFNEDGTLKSESDLKTMFREAGVDLNKPMVACCLTGMTACGVAGAAHVLGKDIPVYYGSWTEWKQRAPDKYKQCSRKNT